MLPTKGSAFPSGHHLSPHPLLSDKGNSHPFWHGPQESSSVSAKQLGTLLAFSFPTFMAGDPKTGCLLRWSLISTGYHGNLPRSGGHPSNPPGSHPDPEYAGECVWVCALAHERWEG